MKIHGRGPLAVGMLVTLIGPAAVRAEKKPRTPTVEERRQKMLEDARSGAGRQNAVEAAKRKLTDPDAETRARAAQTLGKMHVTDAVPLLATALGDDANDVRVAAAEALWNLAPDSKPAVPALEKALQDVSAAVRVEAAGALVALQGGPVSRFVPALEMVLGDEDLGPRAAAVLVDTDLEDAAVRRALLGALTRGADMKEAIFERMAETEMTTAAVQPFVPALAQAIRSDRSPAVRQAAMRVAQTIVPLPKDLSAALQQAAASDADPITRTIAAQAVEQAAGKAREHAVREAVRRGGSVEDVQRAAGMEVEDLVVKWTRGLRTGATEDERAMTAMAMGAMGTGGPAVDIDGFAVALAESLPLEKSAKVRAAIAEAIGDLSGIKTAKAKATATAALKAALKDPDPAVRQAAQKALPRVGTH
jgi:HEAT repeat protein